MEPVPEIRTGERLTAIERELATQGREAKRTRQAYGLFAVMAVLIAIVNLVVISVKLDKKDTLTAGTSQPAASAEPAPPVPLGHVSATTLKEYTITPRPSEVAAALDQVAGLVLEPFERQCEVRAAPCANHRVDFVHDDRAHGAQHVAAAF